MGVPTWIVLGLLEFIVLGAVTAQILRYYASKSSPFYSLLTVFTAWYLGFFGTLFLPIDIAEAYASLQVRSLNVSEVVFPTPGAFTNGTGLFTPTPTPSEWVWNGTNATMLPSFSASVSPSSTASVTLVAPSRNATSTATPTATPTATSGSMSPSPTLTPSTTGSASTSAVVSLSSTPTSTLTVLPTSTGTATGTSSGTSKPTATGTSSARPSGASATATSTKTRTATPTGTTKTTPSPSKGSSRAPAPSTTPSMQYDRRLRGVEEEEEPSWKWPWESMGRRTLQGEGEGAVATASAYPVMSRFPSPSPSSSNSSGASASPAPGGKGDVVWEVEMVEMQVRNGPLESMWFFVYWVTFVLTYAIIPVVQEYVAAGEFSRKGRILASIRINLVFYAVCAFIAFGALAYVVFGLEQTLWDLLPVLTSVANTLGLLVIVPLLGYGAAAVPRALWGHADAEGELRRLYFRAPELDSTLFDVKGELGDTVKDIAEFGSKMAGMAADKEYAGDGAKAAKVKELQRCYAIVLRKVAIAREILGPTFGQDPKGSAAQTERRKKMEQQLADDAEEEDKADAGFFASMGKIMGTGANKYKGINPTRLAKLHKRVMEKVFKVKKQAYRWDSLVERCVELEFIVSGTVPRLPVKRKTAEGVTYYVMPSLDSVGAKGAPKGGAAGNAVPRGGVASGARARNDGKTVEDGMEELSEKAAQALMGMMLCPTVAGGCFNTLMWKFQIHLRPVFFKALSLFAELFSLALLWSEATIWVNLTGLVSENLSVFGRILQAADVLGGHSYVLIQLAAFIPLAYMCACSTYAVFKIKLFDMLDLSGGQNTDPYSLLVNASLFNRLQFSLAFNYLNVLMHSKDKASFPDTAFLHSVGAKMSLSLVDWYIPLLTVVVYVMVKVNVFDRLLKTVFGIEDKGDPRRGDRDDEALIREGAIVVARGRRTLGLGGGADSGMSEEDRRKQENLSRDRIAAVLARAAARRAGQNPDDVARLDDEIVAGVGGSGGGGGASGEELPGGNYASGGGYLSSTQGMFKLDQFGDAAPGGGAGEGASGGGAPGGRTGLAKLGGLGGLGDLARKAKLDKLGSALGVTTASTSAGQGAGSGGASNGEAGGEDGRGQGERGWHAAGGIGGHDGPRRTLSGGLTRFATGGGSPTLAPIDSPPSLAQLLRGKRPGEPSSLGRPGERAAVPQGYAVSASAAASAEAVRRGAVRFDFEVEGGGGRGDTLKTPTRRAASESGR